MNPHGRKLPATKMRRHKTDIPMGENRFGFRPFVFTAFAQLWDKKYYYYTILTLGELT